MSSLVSVLRVLILASLSITSTSSDVIWTRGDATTAETEGHRDDWSQEVTCYTSGSCAGACQQILWCNSFLYTPENNTCRLFSVNFISWNNTETKLSSYFRQNTVNCPLSKGFLLDRASGLCFTLEISSLTTEWNEAKDRCEAKGLRLVSLHTLQRQQAVIRTLRNNPAYQFVSYFTGGSRQNWYTPWPNGTHDFYWLNGQRVDIESDRTYWGENEPQAEALSQNILILKLASDFVMRNSYDSRSEPVAYVCETIE